MIIVKKAIPRRAVLKGLGATLSLPLLDSMVPALTPLARTAARPVQRFTVIYVAHGASPGYWIPATEGPAYELTPPLKPLAAFRDRMLVLTGIDNEVAMARTGDPRGGHGRMAPAFMSGVHCKPTQGVDYQAGISIDQIAANHLGSETQLPSIQVSLEQVEFGGTCDSGYSCVYTNTLCWRSPTMPLPMESNPRTVFERLFGDSGSTDPAERLKRLQQKRSILDSVLEVATGVHGAVGSSDRHLLDEYLESIRDVERRVQIAESQSERELPIVQQPASVPTDFAEYAKMMLDLQVLAYQADLTRVTTFMMAKEVNSRTYPEIGVSDGHHSLSHHGNDPVKKELLARVNAYHTTMLAHFLEKLQTTRDGDGSLLDNAVVLYGSGHGDPNIHDPHELPIIVAGGSAVRPGTGRHTRYSHAQLPDLHVTLLNQAGVPVERVGDSKGRLPLPAPQSTAPAPHA
jgi:hypothetical protein